MSAYYIEISFHTVATGKPSLPGEISCQPVTIEKPSPACYLGRAWSACYERKVSVRLSQKENLHQPFPWGDNLSACYLRKTFISLLPGEIPCQPLLFGEINCQPVTIGKTLPACYPGRAMVSLLSKENLCQPVTKGKPSSAHYLGRFLLSLLPKKNLLHGVSLLPLESSGLPGSSVFAQGSPGLVDGPRNSSEHH